MKAFSVLGLALFVMVAALIQQPSASGDPATPQSDIPFGLRDDIPPGEYTYDEAIALGIIEPQKTPEELGLPPCDPPDPNWIPDDGPVPDDAPICVSDPHDVIISVGRVPTLPAPPTGPAP